MNKYLRPICIVLITTSLTLFPCANCLAGMIVDVSISGQVRSNSLSGGSLRSVNVGDTGVIDFALDSDSFLNSAAFPTRGYAIDQASFTLTFGSTVVALQNPFPAGETPYFVLRDNDPAVDGFFVSRNDVEIPSGLPLSEPGMELDFLQTYSRIDLLTSLDINSATGTYGTVDQTLSDFSVVSGLEALEVDFTSMTVSAIPEPSSAVLVALALEVFIFRRRRSSTRQSICDACR